MMGFGARMWEKTHKKQVAKEQALTKPLSPAGEDRQIKKEDKSKRRKFLDRKIEEAGG